MTDIEQYAQRYAERIEAALIGACPRAVIRAESLATARYATRLATRVVELAGIDDRCPECIRRDSRVRWHDDGSVWYCPVEGCANHADAELAANGKDGAR